jgi:uncharacterized protein YvpB
MTDTSAQDQHFRTRYRFHATETVTRPARIGPPKGTAMSSTTAATISLQAKRPTAPVRPSPSRTPYRPSADTSFSAALKSAANEALAARYASPSAAQIGNPAGSSNASSDGSSAVDSLLQTDSTAPAGVDARLWESLMHGSTFQPATTANSQTAQNAKGATAAQDGQATATATADRAEQLDPATLASMPGMREASQAFLASIKGSDQTATGEYDNVSQARAWGYSTCSAASLTAVLRAAGKDVKIADVMKAMPNGMTIKLGLVSRPSLVGAASQFGAKATDDVTSYDALKQATDNGQPVLVDIRSAKFPEGHWIVVTGVDDNGVRTADSSRNNMTSMSKSEFQGSWSGKGIRL